MAGWRPGCPAVRKRGRKVAVKLIFPGAPDSTYRIGDIRSGSDSDDKDADPWSASSEIARDGFSRVGITISR